LLHIYSITTVKVKYKV